MSLTDKLNGLRDSLKFDNWPALVAQRAFGVRYESYCFHGKNYLVDRQAGDINSVRYCLTSDEYSPSFHAIRALGEAKLRMLDIGANVGGFSIRCAHEGLAIEKLVAVEFHPMTAHRLGLNLHEAYGYAATTVHGALTSFDGELQVSPSVGSTGESIYTKSSTETIAVAAFTFDTLADRYFPGVTIDHCKIDVEGAEYESLIEGSCARLADVQLLTIEIHPHTKYKKEEIVNFLESKGLKRVHELTDQVSLFARNERLTSPPSPR